MNHPLALVLTLLLGHVLGQAASEPACTTLASQAATLIPGYPADIYSARIYPSGTTFDEGNGPPDYAAPVPDLPEFCRFGAFFNTSDHSQVKFEVWLPTTTWNGRFAFVGNGGFAGGVNYPSMGGAITNYGFAVASTNAGHNGTQLDGTFALNNPETQIDFGWRAVHLSTLFAKNVLRAFYSESAGDFRSYWIGCSSGGKQGLKEVQMFPDDYDGVLFGSPAWWWSHLNGYLIEVNLLNAPDGEGHMSAADWDVVHPAIMQQCDGLDGVEDGIIANPGVCSIDWDAIPGITPAQRAVAAGVYANWVSSQDGSLLFPGFSPGAEFGFQFILGAPFPPSPDYFKYQVLNLTSVEAGKDVVFNTSFLEKLVGIADATDPGQTIAGDFDISPFLNRGGKLLGYVGSADELIPYGSSLYFHQQVLQTLGHDPVDQFRLFTVPGMGHCGGGAKSPNNLGADPGVSGQVDKALLDAGHNAILALIRWTENGTAPNQIIGTSYEGGGATGEVDFQRPLCPYPKFPQYIGGDASSASSFVCL
ncbi:tannase and feruloyl esterase [Auricularia subglabra TFB-10046 SS5]|nr:tannase and feruloyl esterase [Auricularia subglabra TFB-10046 SS5]